jgi:thiamine biosynthesis lipoprotein
VFRYLMGTSMQVAAFGGDTRCRRAAIEEAFGALHEVDRLMSNYRSDSELSHVNASAARGRVAVSAPLLSVLEAARRISVDSRGAFDVTVGPLVKLWGFFDKKPHVPTAVGTGCVPAARGLSQHPRRRARAHVRFTRPGVEIDLGGIAKGFAVELAGQRAAAPRPERVRGRRRQSSTCSARSRANASGRSGSRIRCTAASCWAKSTCARARCRRRRTRRTF